MLLLIVLLGLLWGFSAWRRPSLSVAWLCALLPTYLIRTHFGPFPTTLLEIFWVATLVGTTIKCGIKPWREGIEKLHAWWIPVGLWLLASGIAVAVAPDHLAAIGLWRAYILEPILYVILLAGMLQTDADRRRVLEAFLASLAVVTVWAIVQFVTGKFIPHPWDTTIATRRATGPFPYPNALSLFAAPLGALFFAVAFFKQKKWLEPRLAWAGFGFTVICIVLAKSVGAFVGLSSAIGLALLITKKTRWWTMGVIALAIAGLFAVPVTRTKIISTFSFHEWSGKVRTIIWSETWNMLKDTSTPLGVGRPIFGAGLGAYPDVIKPYHAATYIEIFQYPHDIVLNLWSEMGLLGIIAFLWICVAWIKGAKKERWMILPLIAIVVHGLVDVPYFKNDLAMLFWILAALATLPPLEQKAKS